MKRLLARLLIPHAGNGYHPHSIRPKSLLIYLILILAVQLVYNFVATGEVRVLSFATNINQSEVIKLTNSERVSVGDQALTESSVLDQVARSKAADMFTGNYWAHVSPSGVTPWHWYEEAGYRYSYAGENLARDFDSSSGVIAGWMGSPSHRENLLSANYTEIGVAVVNGQLLGHETTLVVQEFGRPQTLGSSLNPAKPGTTFPALAASEQNYSASPDVLALTQLNSGQKLTLFLLAIIAAFFLFDTIALLRNRREVLRGHSFVHTLVLGIVMIALAVSSFGIIR